MAELPRARYLVGSTTVRVEAAGVAFQEELGGLRPHLLRVASHDGDRRSKDVEHLDLVQGDQADVEPGTQVPLGEGEQTPEGDLEAAGQERCRSVRSVEQLEDVLAANSDVNEPSTTSRSSTGMRRAAMASVRPRTRSRTGRTWR